MASPARKQFERLDRAWQFQGCFTATWVAVIFALGWPWFVLHGTAKLVVGILWALLEALIVLLVIVGNRDVKPTPPRSVVKARRARQEAADLLAAVDALEGGDQNGSVSRGA